MALSRNDPAFSCEDAAGKRLRGAKRGIPLRDELKSLLCLYKNRYGGQVMVALHLPGDMKADFDKLSQLLPIAENTRICFAGEPHMKRYGMYFGIVNPVHLDIRSQGTVLQMFDRQLIAPQAAGYTMMTNAGDLTWAMEFCPGELIKAVRNHVIADFSAAVEI